MILKPKKVGETITEVISQLYREEELPFFASLFLWIEEGKKKNNNKKNELRE